MNAAEPTVAEVLARARCEDVHGDLAYIDPCSACSGWAEHLAAHVEAAVARHFRAVGDQPRTPIPDTLEALVERVAALRTEQAVAPLRERLARVEALADQWECDDNNGDLDRDDWMQVVSQRLPEIRAALAGDCHCAHVSLSGVDITPDGPEKLWICDGCGRIGTSAAVLVMAPKDQR